MPIQVKSADAVAKKWAARAGAAGADYSAGVQSPHTSWATATSAAANNWSAGVQQAVGDGRFARGVNTAGDAKWQRKALGVGAQRYPQGVQAAAPDFSAAITPVLQVIAGVNLPARLPKGDPGNMARATAVATSLRAWKLQH
jgi:hypothetical protein